MSVRMAKKVKAGDRESIAIRVPHAGVAAFNSCGDSSLAVIMRFASLTSITCR